MDFSYPINVICFNRPTYLKQLLDSLEQQTIELPDELLHFWVDGYSGSKDEMRGTPDLTSETVIQILEYFPKSQVMVSEENLGIARNYWRAEKTSFEILGASSAFFLEEDLVLSPHYFELTMKMDVLFSHDTSISHFSPTGDVAHTSSAPEKYFQAFGHNWGYLLRGWHHFERKELLEDYIDIVSANPYHLRHRNQTQILEHFFNKGIILAGTSQDAIKDGLRNFFGRVSVTTLDPWASNIGVMGEHFQSESPHHNRPISEDLTSFPSDFDPTENMHLRLDGNTKTISQVYENYLSHFQSCLGERDVLLGERDVLLGERDVLLGERDVLLGERDVLLGERDVLLGERDVLLGERDVLLGERDVLLGERDVLLGERDVLLGERDVLLGERDVLLGERDVLLGERDVLLGERDVLLGERDVLLGERDVLLGERDVLLGERDVLLGERDALVQSTIWRSTRWLRTCKSFTRRFLLNGRTEI